MVASWPADRRWAVAYTMPENYGDLDGMGTWKDVIVAPLAEPAALLNEAHGRGVIIMGHEADRLSVALAELEPPAGAVVIANNPRRPDWRATAVRKNKSALARLEAATEGPWERADVNVSDPGALARLVADQVHRAREHKAPVVLFPFGPKALVFAAAVQLCTEYPEGSWFVYPVPSGYDVDYSEGVGQTLWLLPHSQLGRARE
jgi:hypothetical protein